MNEETKAIEKYLPLWGQTICSIIDHFFTRKEKHIAVVGETFSTRIDTAFGKLLDNAPQMVKAMSKTMVATIDEVDTVMKERAAAQQQAEAEEAAKTEQPN